MSVIAPVGVSAVGEPPTVAYLHRLLAMHEHRVEELQRVLPRMRQLRFRDAVRDGEIITALQCRGPLRPWSEGDPQALRMLSELVERYIASRAIAEVLGWLQKFSGRLDPRKPTAILRVARDARPE